MGALRCHLSLYKLRGVKEVEEHRGKHFEDHPLQSTSACACKNRLLR